MPTAELLSNVGPEDILTDPFAHVVRRDALSAARYEQLAADFPPLSVIADGRTDLGSNIALRMNCMQVRSHPRISREWIEFFEYHTSGSYWRELVRLFAGHWRDAHPDLEERIGRAFEDWRVAPRGHGGDADVRLDCQFVVNTPVVKRSSVKPPHVDKSDKIFSALFYMRDPRDLADGGDLQLYRWSRPMRFVKHGVLPGDIALVKTLAYAPNTYVCFVNSPRSAHGVSPRDATDVPRRYINFITELPIRAFRPPQVNRLRRWWHGTRERPDDDY